MILITFSSQPPSEMSPSLAPLDLMQEGSLCGLQSGWMDRSSSSSPLLSLSRQYFLLPIPVLCVVCVLGQRMCYKCVSMSMDGRNCVAMSRTDRSPTSSSIHQTPLNTNTLLPDFINALQCLLLVFLDA